MLPIVTSPDSFVDFLYLDEARVTEYLSRIEGGQSDEELRRQVRELGGGGSVSATVGPIGAEANVARAVNEESERTIRQTAASRFARFLDAWRAAAQEIDESLSQVFGTLQSRMAVHVDCELDIPDVSRFLSSDTDFAGMFEFAQAIGQTPSGFDPNLLAQFTQAQNLLGDKFIIFGLLHQDEPKLVLRLEKRHLRVSATDLEGEVSVVAKVLKKLNENDSVPLLAFPGLDMLPRHQRRNMQTSNSDQVVNGPAVSLDVVAIYR